MTKEESTKFHDTRAGIIVIRRVHISQIVKILISDEQDKSEEDKRTEREG